MPRSRAGTLPSAPIPRSDAVAVDDTANTLQELASEADRHILRAASNHESMQTNIRILIDDIKQVKIQLSVIRNCTLIFPLESIGLRQGET